MADIKTPYSAPGVRDASNTKLEPGHVVEERYVYYIPATGEILGITSAATDADDGQNWGSNNVWTKANPGKVVAYKEIEKNLWLDTFHGGNNSSEKIPMKMFTFDGSNFVKKSQAEIDTINKANYSKRRRGGGQTGSLSYPSTSEQLDLIYHDITAEKLDTTGEWHKAIKAVKDDNPKP